MGSLRTIYNRETHARLLEIVKDYEGHDASTDLMLNVGNRDLSSDLENGDWQVTEDSAGWVLSANVTGLLATRDFLNAPVRLDVNIAGIFLPVFAGAFTVPENHDDFSSTITAGTPGINLDKIPLRDPVEYIDKPPEWVIRDALYRIRRYDKGNINVPAFGRPIINKLLREGDGFEDNQFPSDILASVADLINCTYYDEPIGFGHTCYRDIGTGEGERIAWDYDADDDRQVYAWSAPTPASPAEQFTSVVVRERRDDGSLRFWEEFPVFYQNLKYAPEQGQTMFVDFSTTLDPEDDPLDTLTKADAARRAKKEADALGRMLHFGSFDVAFNPFLKPQNVLTLESTREDDTGRYRTIWRSVITGLTHPFEDSSIYTTIDHSAVIVREARLPDAPIVLPGIMPNIVDFSIMRLLVMETEEEVIIDETATWAINEGETVLFSDDAPVTDEGETVLVNR